MTWVMLGVLAFTIVTAFRRGNDLLSPTRIYVCIYALLLSVYHLNLSRLQTPWSTTSNLLFYGASGMFLMAGLWIWLLGRIRRPDWNLDLDRVKAALMRDAATVDWGWFAKVYLVCFWIYVISFGVSFFIVGGVPAFMPEPDEARIKFFGATQLTNYGIFMGPISLMLGVVQLWFSQPDRSRKRSLYITMGILLGLYMLIVTRYDLFRVLIFAVAVFHYGKRNLRPVHILGGLVLASMLFLTGFLIRVNVDSIGAFNEMIKVKMPRHLAWASNIYAYLANDFWNYDFAITKFTEGGFSYPLQYGMGLFRALLWNLRLEPYLLEAFHFDSLYNESATKLEGLNTVIYVWHFYKDFGIPGALIMPLIAGLFAWKFYLNSMMSPTLFRISLWGVFAGALALSYHTPLWEMWFVYLNLIVIFVAHRKVRVF